MSLCDSKRDEISSRDFPFVSGIIQMANTIIDKQDTANIDQTLSTPKCITIDG